MSPHILAKVERTPLATEQSSGAIRLAEPRDQEAVEACVNAAYMKWFLMTGRKPAPMEADYADLIERRTVHVVDAQAGACSGVGVVMMPEAHWMFLENVAVHPDLQHQGLGRRLLAFVEECAREAGLPEIRLYTGALMVENIRLYKQLGYQQTDRRLDHGFDRVFMAKRLDA